MAMKLYSDSDISDIADAIRSKNGSSDTYKVSQMASAILAIPSGGITPTGTKSILLTEAGTKTEDVASYASAEINAVKSATASGAVASFSDGAEDVPMDSCVVDIEPVQSGSGDPSPSNVRPISGWSEVNVNVTGVNLFDKDTLQVGYVDDTTGEVRGQTGSMNYRCTDFIRVASGNTYYIKTTQTSVLWGAWYDKNKSFLSGITNYANATKTAPADAYYMRLTVSSNNTGDANTFAVNYPSTDTAYHAYTGTEYPVSLSQTVYGGTLDVVSGVLTVDRAIVDLGTLSWNYVSGSNFNLRSTDNIGAVSPATLLIVPNAISSVYPVRSYSATSDTDKSLTIVFATSGQAGKVWVHDTSYTDAASFKIAMNGVQLVYELAEPTTVQLTPTEVTTLLGSNSVWADSGDIAVGYKADVYLTEGGVTPTGTKSITITSNGTTTEDVTNYASASITTNVPASAVDTGAKSISSNGTHDVVGYASASVNVPNSYSASDEGKVVSNGALVAQTSDTVTANDTYDTTLINSLTVNVSGGGGISVDDIATNTQPSGAITLGSSVTSIGDYALAGKPITSITAPSVTSVGQNSLQSTQITTITDANFPSLGVSSQYSVHLRISALQHIKLSGQKISLSSGSGALRDNANLVSAEFPHCAESVGSSATSMGVNCFYGCKKLELVDMGKCGSIGNSGFYNCNALTTIIMRKTSLVTLANANALASGTPFKSGGTGGTIYIPKALYDHLGDGTSLDYKAATNWSTVDGYGTITWHKIEGSIYEL